MTDKPFVPSVEQGVCEKDIWFCVVPTGYRVFFLAWWLVRNGYKAERHGGTLSIYPQGMPDVR